MSTEDQDAAPEGLAHLRLAGLLKRSQSLLIELYAPALAPHGIDGRELAVLALLADHGPLSQQDLSRSLDIDRTTMVLLIDRLTGKDLVQRTAHAHDRRRNMVQLGDRGRDVQRQAATAIDGVERAFLQPLPETHQSLLKELLRQVITVAEKKHP